MVLVMYLLVVQGGRRGRLFEVKLWQVIVSLTYDFFALLYEFRANLAHILYFVAVDCSLCDNSVAKYTT